MKVVGRHLRFTHAFGEERRSLSLDPTGGESAAGGTDELAALYRIAGLSAARPDSDAVSDVLRLVPEVIPCERPLIFLYEESSDQMHVHDVDGEGVVSPMSEPSIVRRIFHSGRAEIVNDVFGDHDSDTVLTEGFGGRQIAAAPIEVAHGRLGVVAAVNSPRGAFVETDLRFLMLVADRAASMIENAQLRELMDRQSQELTGLQRVSRLLASAETVDYAVDESVRIISDLLECEKTAILLYEEHSNHLVIHTPVAGMSDEDLEGLEISLAEPSLVGTVFRTDTPLLSNRASTDAWVSDGFREAFGIETLLVAPLTSGPRPIGVLAAVNALKGSFSDSDLQFASLLGARIGGVIDASRARERERALLQSLREADRTKTEFVSMLAHELKGPMTTIKGFGEVLRDQWDSMPAEQRARFFDIVSKEIDRLARLVNDLLDVSRIEAGTLRYEMEPIDLSELVESILAVHPSLRSEHTITNDVPNDLPGVMGDRDRIRQVLLNLLTNATRYAPEGTTVTIGAETLDGEVRVWVSDEGIGIAPEDRDRVFFKFVMLPKPGWVKEGTGLGLYITKGIVEAHGGRIWIDSEPGQGSTFYFTLSTTP
jgi:signal transduction histidine kinase